ncbi:hypothetical protein AB0C51_23365 [Streptomyces pathocidini]|uniref:hypothetical protein n=1 Tax=Streptomyces pathocidini TaxID=1650571 RepID=UPI0033DEF068
MSLGAVRHNLTGGGRLRLNGIEALETHYRPQNGPELRQPRTLGNKASPGLLDWLGFTR